MAVRADTAWLRAANRGGAPPVPDGAASSDPTPIDVGTTRGPGAAGACSGLERGAGLGLVDDGPVEPADAVAGQEVEPPLRLGEIQRAVPAGGAGTPLGHEQREARGHRGLRLGAQRILVRRGI